jgi:hypothetical protein
LNKLPETLPTLQEVYIAVRLGLIAGITFYGVNKVFSIESKKTENKEVPKP